MNLTSEKFDTIHIMMIPTNNATRCFIRFASSKAKKGSTSTKIPVQLLKDIEYLGVKGQVIKVKPAFMRNFLHVDNKACYITKDEGPRIPVVENAHVKKRPVEKKTTVTQSTGPETSASKDPALSLDQLSDLFSAMRKSRKPVLGASFATETSVSFSLADLEEALPSVYTVNDAKFPVTTETLSQAIFNSTGIEVPVNLIRLRDDKENTVAEISTPGMYSWTFLVPGESSLKKSLRVQ